MRPTTTLTAAGLISLALLTPTSAATAAAETCRGEAATIVGTAPILTGTEGRDVIVTGRATEVSALGGDDLVCVVPIRTGSNVLDVDAGFGNDIVDTTGATSSHYVGTDLGPGADLLEGGVANDTVITGDAYGGVAEVDTVRAGAGNDGVTTGGGSDVADLGPGDDRLGLEGRTTTPAGALAGGDGFDTLKTAAGSSSGEMFDMAAGSYRTVATEARFSSFEGLDLDARSASIGYASTSGPDHLNVDFLGPGPSTLTAALLGGDDVVYLDAASLGAGSRIDMGTGDDRLVAARSTGDLDLDLDLQQLRVDDIPFALSGAEDAFLMAPEVSMVGDQQDNSFTFLACEAELSGGHGDDELTQSGDYVFEEYSFGCAPSVVMRGGPGVDSLRGTRGGDRLLGDGDPDTIIGSGGNDRIRGGAGADWLDGGNGRDDIRGQQGRDVLLGRDSADKLVGGAGRDKADGAAGRDRCVAEREVRCER